MSNNLVYLIQFEEIVIRLSCRMNLFKVLIFVSPFNLLIVHGSLSFHTGLVPSECSSRLSVCIFSPCSLSLSSHWTFTIHANSGAGAEPPPLIGPWLLTPASHWSLAPQPCWQKRITRCSIISLEEWFIHSSDTARDFCTPVTSHARLHAQGWNVMSTFTFEQPFPPYMADFYSSKVHPSEALVNNVESSQ